MQEASTQLGVLLTSAMGSPCRGASTTWLLCRSASRIGESDGQINRKRIKALRKELEEYGWKSLAQL